MIDICRTESEASILAEQECLFEFQTKNGPLVRFRHVEPSDAELIADSIRTASSETLLHRFFSPIRSVPIETLRTLLKIDRPASLCIVGEIDQDSHRRIICGVRFVRLTPDETMAEFAITVHDEFHNRGLGTFLLRKLAEEAERVGVLELEGYVLYSNTAMRRLIRRMSPVAQWSYLDEVARVVIPVNSLTSPQPIPSFDAVVDASSHSLSVTNRRRRPKSKPQSVKRMLLRLARLLSMRRWSYRPDTSNQQSQPSRPRPLTFRRRPR